MAALEVVYKRLKSVGIGEYCMEIHSKKANKKHVLNQLNEAYETKHPGTPIVEKNFKEFVSIRDQLNQYSSTLHSTVDPFGKSPYWFIGQLNQLKGIEILDIDLSNLNEISFEQYESVLLSINSLEERISIVGHPNNHPFFGCEIDSINEYQVQLLEKDLKNCISDSLELDTIVKRFSALINIDLPNLDSAVSYCNLLGILSEDHDIPESLSKLDDIYKFEKDIDPVLRHIDTFNEQRKNILEKYEQSIFGKDIKSILTKLTTAYKYITRYISPEYYKIRNEMRNDLLEDIPLSYLNLLEDIKKISLNLDFEEQIKATPKKLIDQLSSLWKNSKTQPSKITTALNWLKKYRELRLSKSDDATLIQFILSSSAVTDEMTELKMNIEDNTSSLLKQMENIIDVLRVVRETVFPQGIEKISMEDLANKLDVWTENLQSIVDWTRYLKALSFCRESGLEIFIEYIFSQNEQLEDLDEKF